MPNEIRHADDFERVLDHMAKGFTRNERAKINQAGAETFVNIMKPKIPKRTNLKKGEKLHLRDALITEEHANGSVSVGFSGKSNKGYIGRLVNDGWDSRDRNGQQHKHVAGKHYWESAQREAKGKVGNTIASELVQAMQRKTHGG